MSSAAAASLMLVSCGAPGSTAAPVKVSQEPQLSDCPASDPGRTCEFNQQLAPRAYAAALKGDYEGQRNIGFLLSTPQSGIKPAPVEGCAWRMVTLAKRPTDSLADEGNYRSACGALGLADRHAAETLAGTLHRRIYNADLPQLPPI